MFVNDDQISEVQAEPGALSVLHGFPADVLIGWLDDPPPNPEIRAALRTPLVRSALREIAARRRADARSARHTATRRHVLAGA